MSRRKIPVTLLLIGTAWVLVGSVADVTAQTKSRGNKLVPHHISLANGKTFDLNLPKGFAISVAAQGLRRLRWSSTISKKGEQCPNRGHAKIVSRQRGQARLQTSSLIRLESLILD